jgi:hypothetical protein
MPRRTIRLTTDTDGEFQSAAKLQGYSSPRAFVSATIQKELEGGEDTIIGADARIAASLEQVRGGSLSPRASQQALFGFVDSLAGRRLPSSPTAQAWRNPHSRQSKASILVRTPTPCFMLEAGYGRGCSESVSEGLTETGSAHTGHYRLLAVT